MILCISFSVMSQPSLTEEGGIVTYKEKKNN